MTVLALVLLLLAEPAAAFDALSSSGIDVFCRSCSAESPATVRRYGKWLRPAAAV